MSEDPDEDNVGYEFDEVDHVVVAITQHLISKVLESCILNDAERAVVLAIGQELAQLPYTPSNLNASLSLISPRRKFGDHEIYHHWGVEVEGDVIRVGAGGHFYRPSTGGDSFTSFRWVAWPGCETECQDFSSSLQLVDDAKPFGTEIEELDLRESGYTVSVTIDGEDVVEDGEFSDEDEDDDTEGDGCVDTESTSSDNASQLWILVLWVAFLSYCCFAFDLTTVLIVVGALMLLVPLLQGSLTVMSLLMEVPVEELSIYYGPTLYERRISSFVLKLNSVPMGGITRFTAKANEQTYVWKKLVLCLSGALFLLMTATVFLGFEGALKSIFDGVRHIVFGTLSPLKSGTPMLSAAHEFLRAEPFGVALGMVAAKMCSLEILPLWTNAIGRCLLLMLKTVLPISETLEMRYALVSLLIYMAIFAMWFVAIVGYPFR